jgi:hypothetical protein
VLTVENRGRQKERGKILGNHGKSRKGGSKSILANIKCWIVGRKDILRKTGDLQRNKEMDNRKKNQEENVSRDVLQDALILSLDNITNSWVLYLGASFHATPHKKYFRDYVQRDFGQIYLGDGEPCKIVGMGKVQIKLRNGNQWLLKEVRHVPNLRRNIISTRQLVSEGCISTFTEKAWKVTKGSLVIKKGEKVGTLYLCIGNVESSISLAFIGVDTTFWHHRLGHMSEKGMKILQKRNFL